MMSLQKKIVLFCDGEVFSLDRGLLMGASICNPAKVHVCFVYLTVFGVVKTGDTKQIATPQPLKSGNDDITTFS